MFDAYLADGLVALHVAYVAFIVLGQLLILAGLVFRWQWVRNFWFRLAHLVAIAIVGLLIRAIATTIRLSVRRSPKIVTSPEANRSFKTSTAVVSRVTSRPTGFRSKNARSSRFACSMIVSYTRFAVSSCSACWSIPRSVWSSELPRYRPSCAMTSQVT